LSLLRFCWASMKVWILCSVLKVVRDKESLYKMQVLCEFPNVIQQSWW
jgi:hypothetical protein